MLDVDAIVKDGRNKIATLDLAKAYDKVNRKILLNECDGILDQNTRSMIRACLDLRS